MVDNVMQFAATRQRKAIKDRGWELRGPSYQPQFRMWIFSVVARLPNGRMSGYRVSFDEDTALGMEPETLVGMVAMRLHQAIVEFEEHVSTEDVVGFSPLEA